MSRQLVLISLFAFVTATAVAQNTNSSTTSRPRATGTNTNRSADPPKPRVTQQAPRTPPTARTAPAKPKGVTAQAAQAPGADTVLAAFERLLIGIRKADVKAVSGVYWNSPSLILFNNNGTVTRGWEQMRKNRESSYPDIKDVKLEVRDLAVTMLGRDGAVIDCLWTQSQTYKDVPETATGRMTLVFKRVGKDWKAVHLHTSPDKQDPSRVLPSEESTPAATPSPTPSTMSQQSTPVASSMADTRNLPANHPQVQSGDSKSPQQVLAEVREAISKARDEPNNFEAQMKAAELYWHIQRYDQAIEFLLKANQIKPDSFETAVALGEVNLEAEHYDTAEKWYKAALMKKPDDKTVLAGLAFIALQKHDAAAATKAIENLERVDPNSEDLPQLRESLTSLKSGDKPK